MIGRLLVILCLLAPVSAWAQAPQNLTATEGDEAVSLTWEAPTVEAEDSLLCYRVYRDTTSITDNPEDETDHRIANPGPAESPSYTDTEVTNGVTYYYRVTAEIAEDEDGSVSCGDAAAEESGFSNQASATPGAPAPPSELGAEGDDGSVELSWTANSEDDLAGYDVYRSTVSFDDSADATRVNGSLVTGTTYRDDGVSNGTEYFYRITAVDEAGNRSGLSNQASATPADTTAPSPPTGLDATGGDQEVVLQWDSNAEADMADGSYEVHRSTTGGFVPDEQTLVEEEVGHTGGGESYTDDGRGVLPAPSNGTTYYYRVLAVDEWDNESPPSDTASATPAAPVSLQITQPSVPASEPVSAGSAVDVTVEATNVPADESVQLRYRPGGAASFRSASMNRDGTLFTATIPGDSITARGVEFFVATLNHRGGLVRTPSDGVASIRVQVPTDSLTFSQTGGTKPDAYRIVSVPTRQNDRRLSTLFAELTPYDPAQGRLFSMDSASTGYRERTDLSTRLPEGRGIWLITRKEVTLTPNSGTSLRTDRPYEIPLKQGWNLIGNPFAFEVPYAQLQVTNSDAKLQDVFGYTGTFVPKQEGDVLDPFRGYLVRLTNGQSGTLAIDPSEGTSSASTASTASTAAAQSGWTVDVSARVNRAQDRHNVFGTASTAGTGADVRDGREPPPIGDYVSLAFRPPAQDRLLWRDIRETGTSLQTWAATVRTNVSGMVTLRATGLRSVPEEKAVWLVDPALDLTQNLRETPRYQFPASDDETPHRLRFLVGPPAAVQGVLDRDASSPQRVQLLPSAPHPVRTHATLRYQVPEPTRVTLALYDLLGRRVATLVDDRAVEAGMHAQTWTPSAGTQAVSSGTYLLRLRAGDVTRTRRLVVVR